MTPLVAGTADWTYYERTDIVVPSDRTGRVWLEAYREPSGIAWFDDIRVEEQLPAPVAAFLLYPNFRGMLFDDQPLTVRLDVSTHPPGEDFAGHRVRVAIRDELQGTQVAEHIVPAAPHLVATVDASALVEGPAYLVDVTLIDAAGAAVHAHPPYRVSRVAGARRASMNVAFDDRNRVVMRGTPRFVLGVYDSGSGYSTAPSFWETTLWSPSGDRRMDGLRINAYLNYWYGHTPLDAMSALMDSLASRGVTYLQTGNCFDASAASGGNFLIDTSDAYVQALGSHVASAGYYTADECLSHVIPDVHAQYRRLSQLDPDGVTFAALLGDQLDVFLWADSADLLSTDPYPLAGAEPAGGYNHGLVAQMTRVTRQAVLGARPFMTVLQFFQFTSLGRWPTLEEMRSHAYMSIVEGAQGLWWWSLGSNALRDVCSGWCAAKTQYMNNLKSVVGELADLEPVLLADDMPAALVSNSNPARIRTKVKVVGDKGYVLAFNDGATATSATFTWNAAIGAVTVHAEGRTVAPSGASFTDAFGPWQAHVYVIDTALPLALRVVAPAAGQVLKGTVTVALEATGGAGYRFDTSVDGTGIGSGTAATVAWNTTNVADGAHVVAATVTDSHGRSAQATVGVMVVNGLPPAVPTQFAGTVQSSSQIKLTWRDTSANETGFAIERSKDGKTWAEIVRVPANTVTSTDTGLQANTTYAYRLRSFNVAGFSKYTAILKRKTLK